MTSTKEGRIVYYNRSYAKVGVEYDDGSQTIEVSATCYYGHRGSFPAPKRRVTVVNTEEGQVLAVIDRERADDPSKLGSDLAGELLAVSRAGSVYDGPDGPMVVPADHPMNKLLEQEKTEELLWLGEDDGSFSAEWRPGESPMDLAVLTGKLGGSWVCFEPDVPDVETGKRLAESLAQTAREFFCREATRRK